MFQHLAHFLRALSELFLKLAEQLVVFTFSVGKVVVAQLSVLLLELALDFIPGAFELEFVHVNYSALSAQLAVLDPQQAKHLSTDRRDRRYRRLKKDSSGFLSSVSFYPAEVLCGFKAARAAAQNSGAVVAFGKWFEVKCCFLILSANAIP
jgi:hypothetical protein